MMHRHDEKALNDLFQDDHLPHGLRCNALPKTTTLISFLCPNYAQKNAAPMLALPTVVVATFVLT